MTQFNLLEVKLLKLLAANADIDENTTAEALMVLAWGSLKDRPNELQLAWISDLCSMLGIESEEVSPRIAELREWATKPPN